MKQAGHAGLPDVGTQRARSEPESQARKVRGCLQERGVCNLIDGRGKIDT
jgi:hypothetical protein